MEGTKIHLNFFMPWNKPKIIMKPMQDAVRIASK